VTAPELSIVVLAYDEEENVGPVLRELRDWLEVHEPSAEIVFVDDGSHDRTVGRAEAALAGSLHTLVRRGQNGGIGAALKSGVQAARGAWVTFLPADGQIAPAAIGRLREAQRQSQAELVLSVYEDRDDGLDRKLLSFGVRALIRAVHGVRLQSDGPYLFPRKLLVPEELPPDSFFLNFEVPIRAIAAGLTTATVRIACRPRRAGHSKSTQLRRIAGVARDLVDLRVRRLRGR